ncbi:MAG: SDR family oxidoreductase, partial [Acidobacteriota bacterium]|nr:SDR family oxidoreductase [Acidobacteriota bacterium]
LTFDLEPSSAKLEMIAGPDIVTKAALRTGRIEDTTLVKSLVRDNAITHIVHLAAQLMPFCQANPVQGGLINAIGTLNVFEAARDAGRPVRVIYASSSAVWGPEEFYGSGKRTETDPLRPATHYGVFKQANEGNARVFYDTNGISSIGLRPWTVYGVGRDRGLTADPTLAIRAVAQREKFQIRLSGFMDLQYVEDVADTFIRCLLSEKEGAHAFNLEGSVIGMNDFVQVLETLRPGAADLIRVEGPQVPVAYRMDDAQLRAHIGDVPKTSLVDGVRKTLEAFERLRSPM